MRALLVVDVQYDFLPGGALAVPAGDAVLPVIAAIAPRYDCVLATQDWHPPDHGSFAANHPGRAPGDTIDLAGRPQVLWPVHCVQGTRGAELHEELARLEVARVFRKGVDRDIDSYSGFFDNGRGRATGLGDDLRARGATAVDVVGLATEYCVKFTALDAVAEGFDTRVVLDACRGIERNPGDVARAVEELRKAGVGVLTSGDLR